MAEHLYSKTIAPRDPTKSHRLNAWVWLTGKRHVEWYLRPNDHSLLKRNHSKYRACIPSESCVFFALYGTSKMDKRII